MCHASILSLGLFLLFTTALQSMDDSKINDQKIPDLKNFAALKKSILETPADQILANRFTQVEFCRQSKTKKLTISQSESLCKQFEKKSPIFLIDECAKHGSDICPFNRFFCPDVRQKYEQKVSSALLEKLNDTDFVKYTTLSARQLFPDLRILTMALEQKPTAKIAIDVIDIANCVFDAVCDSKLCANHSIQTILNTEIPTDKKNIVYTHYLPQFQTFDNKNKIIETFSSARARQNQLIAALKNMFPSADLQLNLYNDADHYLGHFEDEDFLAPHILCASDIDQKFNVKPKICASKSFYMLAVSSLLRNRSAVSVHLSEKNGGCIKTIRAKPQNSFDIDMSYEPLNHK